MDPIARRPLERLVREPRIVGLYHKIGMDASIADIAAENAERVASLGAKGFGCI